MTGIVRSPWVISLVDHEPPPLRWEKVFSTPVESVEVEIGSGKGMFLRREAAARPATGFLGVERAVKYFGICAERLARDARPNARVTRADAFDLLARWVPIGSLVAIHVYFPDPWPKKRHAKRRLLSPALFDLAARGLRKGGFLAIATDVAPYFADAASLLESHLAFDRGPATEMDRERAMTNYSIKYSREGRILHLGRWSRNASGAPPIPPPPSRQRKVASSDPSREE